MEAIQTALNKGLTDLGTQILAVIGNVIPAVLPVAGAIIAITVGVKLFKRFSR